MASIWWVVVAFLAGGLAGAVLVALMSISRREDESSLRALENAEEGRLLI